MGIILESLKNTGKTGVHMKDSKGVTQLIYPILTIYVADYPEQCLVTCTKYGTCVKCCQTANNLGDNQLTTPQTKKWTLQVIDNAKKKSKGSISKFHEYCMERDVAGGIYTPFWKDLPFCDIHLTITPDILHQLYQGVFKHVVGWC